MKPSKFSAPHHANAFTLLEMSIVIMVLLGLVSLGLFSSAKITDWQTGRAASASLHAVYAAKRMYLADNPTKLVANLTTADLIPYLSSGATALPVVKSLLKVVLQYKVNDGSSVYFTLADGSRYDPSGSYEDDVWDLGSNP